MKLDSKGKEARLVDRALFFETLAQEGEEMTQADYSAAKPLSNNQRLVLRAASKGYWADRENRRQSSEAQKRIWADQEKRQQRTEASKRAQALPEVRKKKSQASKRTWADPEIRQRRSEGIKQAWASPEALKKTR